MNKIKRYFAAGAGVALLSAGLAVAQGTMLQGDQSGMTQGRNNSRFQPMMEQHEQLQSRVQAADRRLAEELDRLKAAKTVDRKLQIMQTMFVQLIDERNYVHDQVMPMMMSGGAIDENGGSMQSGRQAIQSGQAAMMGPNRHGMMNGGDSGWHQQMMQQRRDIQSRVHTTDTQLTAELQQLQNAKTDARKVQVMQSMLANLIQERNYIHDQALSMMMFNSQTNSARP